MLREITNLLKGEVTARVESGFPERVLNLCGARDRKGGPRQGHAFSCVGIRPKNGYRTSPAGAVRGTEKGDLRG